MKILTKISLKKKNLENKLEKMPTAEAFFKVFVLGNFVLGITSGILVRFFYLALKYTGYEYLILFYTVRFFMYTWLVFYCGFSTIFMLKKDKELPKWMKFSVFFYILFSTSCLYFYETFMPFQALGSELFYTFYYAFIR